MRSLMTQVCLVAVLSAASMSAWAQDAALVEIGHKGAGTAQFAHGPGGWRDFTDDAVFVAGRSLPGRDWPFVHPGPSDNWAGSRSHAFRIVFGVQALPASGDATLELDLVDTHGELPPEIDIVLNGEKVATTTLPAGGGDDGVLDGKLANARPSTSRIQIPGAAFRRGNNLLAIVNRNGSWLLYDHVRLVFQGATPSSPADQTMFVSGDSGSGLVERDSGLFQSMSLTLLRIGAATKVPVRIDGRDVDAAVVQPGLQDVEWMVPAITESHAATVEVDGVRSTFRVRAVPHLTLYVVPHSHTDIGYTDHQSKIEAKQVDNLVKGMALAQATASYPPGARFIWNIEVLWAADLFLQRMDPAQRAAFQEAVKAGRVGLNGLYLNILSGLARPEELMQATRLATRLARELAVPVDSAMISDIPGHSWGLVSALSQAGIKYFSTSPNYFDRIGTAQVATADQPFWWEGPSGRERLLTWNSWMGYALSHSWGAELNPNRVGSYLDHLESIRYPYDITYIRWSGLGDNAEPDRGIADAVKEWNEKYRWPRIIISDQRTPFVELERRYGDRLPVRRGDWTPYWEDGAGSSARETAMNRATADRLTQVGALWAMENPARWPVADVDAAWKNTLLYTEHTWGAWNSVSQPEQPSVHEQWETKKGYAEEADRQSRELLRRAHPAQPGRGFDVVNTSSWLRTDLVVVPADMSKTGDRVLDANGVAVPSQRLVDGSLAVLVTDLPPFSSRRYQVTAGGATRPPSGSASATSTTLRNATISVQLDTQTGAIDELRFATAPGVNFVDRASGHRLNEYLFLRGSDVTKVQTLERARVRIENRGPLVASIVVEGEAPGARSITTRMTLAAGLDRIELATTIDKLRAPAGPKGDYHGADSKESVSLAFPFKIPNGQVRLELPIGGVIRPDEDQIPGSCKNWFSVGNWADVSARGLGMTMVSLDTPLAQVGGLTATLLGSQTNPAVWRERVGPTQALYPWLMNNHWGTNYRAYQEGPVTFRFALRPHLEFDSAVAARAAANLAQPLLVLGAGTKPPITSRLRLSNDRVLVTALKPLDEGPGWIVRLYNATGTPQQVSLAFSEPRPRRLSVSDTSERVGEPLRGPLTIPAWGVVTLRADR